MLLAASIAACGGGSDTAPIVPLSASADTVVVTREADQTANSVRFAETTSTGVQVSSAVPLSAFEKAIITARTSADLDAAEHAEQANNAHRIQARAAGGNPEACRLYRFAAAPTPAPAHASAYWLALPSYYVVSAGTNTADIAPPVTGCIEATVGTSYTGTTPPAGGSVCYQFALNGTTTVHSQVRLPTGITGITELFAVVIPNMAGLKVTDAQSPADPMEIPLTSAYRRYVIMVRPGNGEGGESFSIGIGTAAPVPPATPPNSDLQHPKVVAMNQTRTDAISPTGQKDFYYFYPSTPNQTKALFASNFSPDQTVGYRLAQRSAAGVYTAGAEAIASAANQSLSISGVLPNTVGAAVVNGVMVRVSAKIPAAPVAGSFSIRTGVATGYINSATVWNSEGLNRLYNDASGRKQAYSYIGVNASVIDVNGATVAGESVKMEVFLNESDLTPSIIMNGLTNDSGVIGFQPSISNCPSNSITNYSTVISSPDDHYVMIGSKAKVQITLMHATPITPNNNRNIAAVNFYKVCSENYLGNY